MKQPTLAERITTWRTMGTVSPVLDTLGLDESNPASWHQAVAVVHADAKPFTDLIADIDAFFGDELAAALAAPATADTIRLAEREARRIIAKHLAAATMRLSLTGAAGTVVDWTTADRDTLQSLATAALQRAADQRFTAVVSPAMQVEVQA